MTPLSVQALPAEDRHGRLVLLVVAKLGARVSPLGRVRVLPGSAPIRLSDEHHEPMPAAGAERREEQSPFRSIKYPSDYFDEKPGTDVVFVGTAHPPEGAPPARKMDVRVQVGPCRKTVRIYGTRVFESLAFGRLQPGPAQPLRPTPLRYELAWGGHDEPSPGQLELDPRNPSGLGFAETRHNLVGAPAPRIEVVSSLLEPGTEPAGFGAIASYASPRSEWAGTYDEAWHRSRAPIRPADFDPRFHCVAHPDLQSPTPLGSDEPVEILGARPEGAWRFRLPAYRPRFVLCRDGSETELPTHLDTYLIDADEQRVELSWRACVVLPRKVERLGVVQVRDAEPLPEEVLHDEPLAAAPPPSV